MKTLTFILACALVLPSPAIAQKAMEPGAARSTDNAVGRRDSIAVAPGDIALAAFRAPARIEPIYATRADDSSKGLSICTGTIGKWKCILGGAAVGFVAGALIGNALSPQEVDQTNYACSGFFGCGYYNECVKNCDVPLTRTWVFAIGGSIGGGIGGYYLAKASNR